MAIIPKFDGRFGKELPTNNANPNTQLYVPPARASSLVKMGEAVTTIAGEATKLYVAQQERVAADYATKKTAEIQEFTVKNMMDAKQKALESGNVDGFTNNFLQSYDKVSNQAIDMAPNALAQQKLGKRLSESRLSLLEQSMRFESAAKIDIYRHNLDVATDKYAKTAAMDPSQLPTILKQIDSDMIDARQTLGLVDAEERLMGAKNQVVATAISKKIDEDPYTARMMINRYSDDLSAKDILALNKNADRAEKRLIREAKAAQRQAEELAMVYGAVTGNIPLNPADEKSQKAMDKYYAAVKKNDPNIDFTNTVLQTNMMPTQMKNEIAGKLESGDVSQKVKAAAQLKRIHEAAPNLVVKLSKSDKAKAAMINSYIEAGIDQRRAVEWAEKNVNIKDDPILKQREKAAKKETDLSFDNVKGKFTGTFGGGAEAIPPEMAAEYELLAKAYYIDNGLPADKASEVALNDVKAHWYKSSVTGRERFMKYAPEIEYKNGAGSAWIKEQFEKEYLGIKQLDGKVAEKKDIDNVILQPSPLYQRNGKAVYNMYKIDEETGAIDVVLDEKGKPVIFFPDFEKSPLYEELMKEVPGETFEEKQKNYTKMTQEMQMKQLTRGQQPTGMYDLPLPGGGM